MRSANVPASFYSWKGYSQIVRSCHPVAIFYFYFCLRFADANADMTGYTSAGTDGRI